MTEIVFDERGVPWLATTRMPSTMCKVVEVQRRGAAVLEVQQYPSVMTRRMVRRATREEIEQWREQ